jgi:hypothetical protein
MGIVRPLVGTAVAAGALAGGLALGLSLTGAGAATTAAPSHTAKAAAATSASRTTDTAAAARSGVAAAQPSTPAMKKGKCTHMSGGTPGGQHGPGSGSRPTTSPPASS